MKVPRMMHSTNTDQHWRFDWIAVSYRPDPITSNPREIVIGRGFSTRKDTINIQFDAIPIADSDNFCRVILRPANYVQIDPEFAENWTVLTYKTDKSNATRKLIIGSGWLEDGEILVLLDAIPMPNHNIECWITLKPRIERNATNEIDQ
jgi:hypothetical protein